MVTTICQNLTANTQTAYQREIRAFLNWLQIENRPADYLAVKTYKTFLVNLPRGEAAINQALAAIRFFVRECARAEIITTDRAEKIAAIDSIKTGGKKLGNWLTKTELEKLLQAPKDTGRNSLLAFRDRATLALLGGAGLRRNEARLLTIEQIQQRENRWVIVDLVGKGNVSRSIPIAAWIKQIVDEWLAAAEISGGVILRQCSWTASASTRNTRSKLFVSGFPVTAETIRNAVMRYSVAVLGKNISPHDLRRSFARLARLNGCPIEQIQLSLGHASIKTTQIYLGDNLNLQESASDFLHLEVT